MRNSTIYLFSTLLFVCFFIFSCKKIELKSTAEVGGQANSSKNSARLMASGSGGIESADFIPQDGDSIERETVLGVQLTNPYLIPNMEQAYINLGYNPGLATITNLYVRFKPTIDQLVVLDSIMEAQGLELFDTPVDYQVLYEGDYYQDPYIPDSLPTWQYAVVPPDFVFPQGIPHEMLASIHIPGDEYTAIETEAERLAVLQDSSTKTLSMQPDNFQECPDGFIWDPVGEECIPYRPPQTQPPPPAADAAIPAGYILVHDTQLNTNPDEGVGVRKARVVARRWFKIQRVYTDNNGYFAFTKKFKHKVRINVKFKNDDTNIYGVRDAMVWQAIFPVKRTLGIFSGDKSNITFVNKQEGSSKSKANRYWTAATVQNCVQEHKDYATQLGFSRAPGALHIFLTNWGITEGLASTPLFHIRSFLGVPDYYVNVYMMNSKFHFASPVISALVHVVSSIGVDMAIDYHNDDPDRFKSDWLKETVYHELSHGSQYSKMGNTWYLNFVSAELAEIYNYPSGSLCPYGPGNDVNSPIIALGEAWAYHMGHFLADQRYGVNASETAEQSDVDGYGIFYYPNGINHPHIDVLENFNPNLSSDPFHWIPKGLFYDLLDPANEINPPKSVNDNVSGYTNQQMFNTFQSTIYTLQDYRTRLLQTVTNSTSGQVTNLFSQYHY